MVLTVSDRCFRGEQADVSGPAVRRLLEIDGATVVALEVVPDEVELIVAALRRHDVNLPIVTIMSVACARVSP